MGFALYLISFSLVAASHSGLLKVCGCSGPTGAVGERGREGHGSTTEPCSCLLEHTQKDFITVCKIRFSYRANHKNMGVDNLQNFLTPKFLIHQTATTLLEGM